MKKTVALISLANHIQNKYAELDDGPRPYSNPEDAWIDELRTRLSQLGTLIASLDGTRLERDKTFRHELVKATGELTKVYYRAMDIYKERS